MNNSGNGVWRIYSKPTSVPPSWDDATGNTPLADHWDSLFDSVFNIRTLKTIYVFIYHKQPFWRIWVTLIVITPDASIAYLNWGKAEGALIMWLMHSFLWSSFLHLFTVCFHHRHVPDAFRTLSYNLSSITQVKLRLSLLAHLVSLFSKLMEFWYILWAPSQF